MKIEKGICKGCNKPKFITNRTHWLCLECNSTRMDAHRSFLGIESGVQDKKAGNVPTYTGAFVTRAKKGTKPQSDKSSKQDDAFYLMCAIQLPHVCGYCGEPILGEFTRMNCDHVFEKSKFPHLRYVIEDICPTCFDCHQVKTSGKYTDRMEGVMEKTSYLLISMGLLEQIGEPDCNRIKDWVIKPMK